MRLHRRDGNPTDYQGVSHLSILPLPVSLPVEAWFVPESSFPVVTEKLARFNQVFWSKLLPVFLNPDKTRSRIQDGKADTQILHINAR